MPQIEALQESQRDYENRIYEAARPVVHRYEIVRVR